MGLATSFAKLLLVALIGTGITSTWKLSYQNGTFEAITKAISGPEPRLPGSFIPMRKYWTGIRPLDEQLCGILAFFWPIFQGDFPPLCFLTVQFYGQLIAIWMLLLVESFRIANAWRMISFVTITGILVEYLAAAVIIPMWCLGHLVTSPIASAKISASTLKTSLLVHPAELRVLPWSVLVGCGIPSILTLISNPAPKGYLLSSKQSWILIRQFHPLLTSLVHLLLSVMSRSGETSYVSAGDRNRNVTRALRRVYSIATYIAMLPHGAVLALVLARKVIPSIISEEYRAFLVPSRIFLPQPFWLEPVAPVESSASGVQTFLQWDALVSCLTMLVWTTALNRDALYSHPRGSSFQSLFWRMAILTCIGGPATAAISAIRERDEILLESPETSWEKREG